jgi:plastocyanin
MRLSRLCTTVSLAVALAVPTLAVAPAYASSQSVAFNTGTGFSPAVINAGAGDSITITNKTAVPVSFVSSWGEVHLFVPPNGSAAFTQTPDSGVVAAAGPGEPVLVVL